MKRVAIAGAISLAILGCTTMSMGDGTGGTTVVPDCDDTGVCKVSVTMNKCKVESPVPDPLTVPKGKHNVIIQWELDRDSWLGGNKFVAEDGIVIKDAQGQFDQPNPTGVGKKFSLHDKNEYLADFKYSIHVKSFWYGDCPVLDPTIKNQG